MDLKRRLELAVKQAWASLAWERLARAFWPVTTLLIFFAGFAFLGLFEGLEGGVHLALLLFIAAGLGWTVWRGWKAFTPPTGKEAQRYLENRAGLEHQPLDALEDHLSGEGRDPVTVGLWRAHLDRMACRVASLKAGLPSPSLTGQDRYGLMNVALVILVAGLLVAQGTAFHRLTEALAPDIMVFSSPVTDAKIWITPPEYTRRPPIQLEGGAATVPPEEGATVAVPAGSTLLALVQGGGSPSLSLGKRDWDLEEMGDGSYRVETEIGEGGKLTLGTWSKTLGTWDVVVIADGPPAITFTHPPAETARWRLRLDYKAEDDHGVEKAGIVIRNMEQPTLPPLELDLPIAKKGAKSITDTAHQDLTAHPWAGQMASVELTVSDAIGQSGQSNAVPVRLPERIFSHPVAKIIAGERKQLIADPAHAPQAAMVLDALTVDPSAFADDRVVFLALRFAVERLAGGLAPEQTDNMLDLLWNAALRLEEGNVALAEAELDRTERALMDALDRDASAAELEQLMAEYQAAIRDYMKALGDQLAQGDMPTGDMGKVLDMAGLADMLAQMQALAASGAKDAARQMLDQMRAMLQTLRNARLVKEMPPGARKAAAILEALRRLAARQEALLNETHLRDQQQSDPNFATPKDKARRREETKQGALTQEEIRRALGVQMEALAEILGSVPENLGAAELDMRDSVKALRKQNLPDSIEAQGQALDNLRRGAATAMQDLSAAFFGKNGISLLPGAGGPGANLDPAGRPMGAMDGGDVKIPARGKVQKSRIILEELRRRAGDPNRPAEERDYLRRLLKQF